MDSDVPAVQVTYLYVSAALCSNFVDSVLTTTTNTPNSQTAKLHEPLAAET